VPGGVLGTVHRARCFQMPLAPIPQDWGCVPLNRHFHPDMGCMRDARIVHPRPPPPRCAWRRAGGSRRRSKWLNRWWARTQAGEDAVPAMGGGSRGCFLPAGLRAARAQDRDLSPVLEGALHLLRGSDTEDVLELVVHPVVTPHVSKPHDYVNHMFMRL
jgi:hypothetical protein